jgi:glycosyltransferase involved in cell wall biosynthesis
MRAFGKTIGTSLDDRMKILFSIHHEIGGDAGAPGVTLRLAKALEARGHQVTIRSYSDSPHIGWVRTLGFPFALFKHVWQHPEYDVLDLSSGDGWVINLFKHFFGWRAGQRSFTRSHGLEHTVDQFERKQAKTSGIPLSWKYPIYHGGFRLWECKQSFVWANGSLMLNKYDADVLNQRFGIAPSKIFRVPNAADDIFLSNAARLKSAAPPSAQTVETFGIAYVGSWLERKGVRYLAQALNEILGRHPQVHVGLFGTGAANTAAIQAALAPEHFARVKITPRFKNLALPELLSDYHVLAFPTLSEGFPLGPIEAMACGLVPITSDTPGPTEYISDGQNGLVVPPRDAPALALAIDRLIADPAFLMQLRERALDTASSYSWPAIAELTERIYLNDTQGAQPH